MEEDGSPRMLFPAAIRVTSHDSFPPPGSATSIRVCSPEPFENDPFASPPSTPPSNNGSFSVEDAVIATPLRPSTINRSKGLLFSEAGAAGGSSLALPCDGRLRLRNAPGTPRTLLNRTDIMSPHRPATAPTALCVASANTNPFTPDTADSKMKRNRSKRLENKNSPAKRPAVVDENTCDSPHKRMPSQSTTFNVSRFAAEFMEIGILGAGEFGTVFECKHRLDGITYAIKRTSKPIQGKKDEQKRLREVYAHAVLQVQPHIVRYYSAWEENNNMLIQNEYCDGGSLEKLIQTHQREGRSFSEAQLLVILRHLTLGLRAMHEQNLVHMDIKPGNVFIKTETTIQHEGDLVEEDEADGDDVFMQTSPDKRVRTHKIYKIGDLGHVTRIDNPSVEEGDVRYLANEILQEDYSNLTKADIFSLGMTIYETASLEELPKNGDTWLKFREDEAPPLDRYSPEFNALIRKLICRDPKLRPSCDDILRDALLVDALMVPGMQKSKAQLCKELTAEKMRAKALMQQLKEAKDGKGDKPKERSTKFSRSNSVSW